MAPWHDTDNDPAKELVGRHVALVFVVAFVAALSAYSAVFPLG